MAQSDALVVGSPVYYGVPAGQVMSIIQRMAYAGGAIRQIVQFHSDIFSRIYSRSARESKPRRL